MIQCHRLKRSKTPSGLHIWRPKSAGARRENRGKMEVFKGKIRERMGKSMGFFFLANFE